MSHGAIAIITVLYFFFFKFCLLSRDGRCRRNMLEQAPFPGMYKECELCGEEYPNSCFSKQCSHCYCKACLEEYVLAFISRTTTTTTIPCPIHPCGWNLDLKQLPISAETYSEYLDWYFYCSFSVHSVLSTPPPPPPPPSPPLQQEEGTMTAVEDGLEWSFVGLSEEEGGGGEEEVEWLRMWCKMIKMIFSK